MKITLLPSSLPIMPSTRNPEPPPRQPKPVRPTKPCKPIRTTHQPTHQPADPDWLAWRSELL
jgi:hypothetical protein